jgi:hypothetical protein
MSSSSSRSIRTGRSAAVFITALMGEVLSFGQSRATPVWTDVVPSYPRVNVVVDGSVVHATLGFEVPVDHELSTLTLRSGQGRQELRPRLESAPNYLFSNLGRLAPGAYELAWEARLAGGQIRRGTVPFTINSEQASVSAEHVSRIERERHREAGTARPVAPPAGRPQAGRAAEQSSGHVPVEG